MFYAGSILVIAIIASIGLLTAKKKNEKYDNSRKATAGLVAGALVGTLVGGSSTIGTAQLAYNYGFSAWWFTLGGGIGVFLLGFFFAKPLYQSNVNTLADVIEREYGKKSGFVSAILSSVGTFLSFVAQIISGTALIMTVTNLSFLYAILIVAALIIVYVFWGGTLALGYGGLAKTILLSLSVLMCGFMAIQANGGFSSFVSNAELPSPKYFNLFARGFLVDGGSGVSLLIGVITTQSYISAILMAKSLREAKKGAYITAIIVPIMGIAGIFIGMYMRLHYPGIDTKLALPMFIMEKMPPFVSGMMIAALLVAVTGTGAGLSFGIASMVYRNVYKQIKPDSKDKQSKRIIQLFLLFIIVLGCTLCYIDLGDLILSWSYLSMGLRGAVAFFPLIVALFYRGKVKEQYVIASMICGVFFTFLGKMVLPAQIDPLFLGLAASLIVMTMGALLSNKLKKTKE